MMTDRTFAVLMLALAVGYGIVAFGLKAPFQYDPLGPEGWPKLLAFVLAFCALGVLIWPDPEPGWGERSSLVQLAISVIALVVYAALFRDLGFIITTTVFCAGIAIWLGAPPVNSVLFALGIGLGGYLVCTRLMGLNLPAGVIPL